MKTRRSIGDPVKYAIKRGSTRTRKKRSSLDSNQLGFPTEGEEKDGPMEFEHTESLLGDPVLKIKDKRIKKERPSFSLYSTLVTNNRALATSLENVRVKLREVELRNNELKKQIQAERFGYLGQVRKLEASLCTAKESMQREAKRQVQRRFEEVGKLLENAVATMLAGSNLLSSAMSLVSDVATETNGAIECTPYVAEHICATTPPPEEPMYSPLTAEQAMSDSISGCTPAKRKSVSFIRDVDVPNNKKHRLTSEDDGVEHNENELIGPNVDEPMETLSEITSTPITSHLRRRSRQTGSVSYTEPSLRSKLRRGDPYTDSGSFESPPASLKKKRRSSSSSCKKRVTRSALANLTNRPIEEDTSF